MSIPLRKLFPDLVPESPAESAETFETLSPPGELNFRPRDKYGRKIALNAQQRRAVDLALAGRSFVLTGGPGTGKTTTITTIIRALSETGKFGEQEYRVPRSAGESVWGSTLTISSFTNKAVSNLRTFLRASGLDDLLASCTTLHNLLEYAPAWGTDENGDRTLIGYFPRRDADNPIDTQTLILDEAPTVNTDLAQKLFDAATELRQLILIGDPNQLQPTFGRSLLNYGLLQMEVIELTEVYRQAADNPIVQFAHDVLLGHLPVTDELSLRDDDSGVRFSEIPKKYLREERESAAWFSRIISNRIERKTFVPGQDIILCPWAKRSRWLSVYTINLLIARFLAREQDFPLQNVVCGYRTQYEHHRNEPTMFHGGQQWLYEGAPIIADKEEYVITSIRQNDRYQGVEPYALGTDPIRHLSKHTQTLDRAILQLRLDDTDDDDEAEAEFARTLQASHIVECENIVTGETKTLSRAVDFSDQTFSLGFCTTMHKSQGSEWRDVYLIAHPKHLGTVMNEHIYTGVTRARRATYAISSQTYFRTCIRRRQLDGTTVAEKQRALRMAQYGEFYSLSQFLEADND